MQSRAKRQRTFGGAFAVLLVSALAMGCGKWVRLSKDESALLRKSGDGDTNAIALLLDKGVNPNVRTPNLTGMTPLLWAVYERRWNAAVLLLERGADPNLCDGTGRSPFFFAVNGGDDALIFFEVAFAKGAIPGAETNFFSSTNAPNLESIRNLYAREMAKRR